MKQLLLDIASLIDSVMGWVFIGSIILGVVILLVLFVLIFKRVRYSKQMKHNKIEKKKMLDAIEKQEKN